MKKILVCLFLFSATAFADQPVKELSCSSQNDSFQNFNAKLDPNGFQVGSGLYFVPEANVGFEYSSARLICAGNTPDALSCIGYWYDIGGDIAEVKTSKDSSGKISATFVTSKLYGLQKVTLPCTF